MHKKYKTYLKLNAVSIIFIAISFISITFAWFAYSGTARMKTEVNVKAWYIELSKNGQTVSNEVVISLDEIHPGMDVVNEKINIKNLGDSDANIKYEIVSTRILNSEEIGEENSKVLEDKLAHDYPFKINANLSQNYVLTKEGESNFEVSISWPLDSDTDQEDSYWGQEAYKFQKLEEETKQYDPNYTVRPSIQVVLSLTAEQVVNDPNNSDYNYNMGQFILFNPITNKRCETLSDSCLKATIIDSNNKVSDTDVHLMIDPNKNLGSSNYHNYDTTYNQIVSTWTTLNRKLEVADILELISRDITNSILIRDGLSPSVIGRLLFEERITKELTKAKQYLGYYQFSNDLYSYLSTSSCYWTNSDYNSANAFAIKRIDDETVRLYPETKDTICKVIPVLTIQKELLN